MHHSGNMVDSSEIPRPTTWDASSPGKQWDFNYQPQLPSKWWFLRFFFFPCQKRRQLTGSRRSVLGTWHLLMFWARTVPLCWSPGSVPWEIPGRSSEQFMPLQKGSFWGLPSRKLTYPTWGKGKSSSTCHFWGIC